MSWRNPAAAGQLPTFFVQLRLIYRHRNLWNKGWTSEEYAESVGAEH